MVAGPKRLGVLFVVPNTICMEADVRCSRAAGILAVLLTTGCSIPIDSVMGGGGAAASDDEPKRSSTLSVPLNFQIRPRARKAAVGPPPTITEARIRDFLGVGVSRFARDYAVPLSGWRIDVKHSTESPVTPIQRLPNGQMLVQAGEPEYTARAKVTSPVSRTLSKSNASSRARLLISTDRDFSAKRTYRVTFHATVVAKVHDEIPNTVFFDVTIAALLEGKSHFAKDEHYKPVEAVAENKVHDWNRRVGLDLLHAYVKALRGLGLEVRPVTE